MKIIITPPPPYKRVWFFIWTLRCYYLVVPHSYKHNSTLPKDALCQVSLKLVQWFWRRRKKYLKFTTTTSTTITGNGLISIRKALLQKQRQFYNVNPCLKYFQNAVRFLCFVVIIKTLFYSQLYIQLTPYDSI